MKRTLVALGMVALLATLPACFKHTYVVGAGAPEGEIVYRHWHHHWLFGLIRPELQKQLDVTDFCPSGDATIHEEVSFANGVVDVLVGLIYSPTTVTVRCADGAEAEVELDTDDVAQIALDPLFLDYVAEVAPYRLSEARLALNRESRDSEDTELALAAR